MTAGTDKRAQPIPLLAMFGPEPTVGQIRAAIQSAQNGGWLCHCIGPQRGEPVCPCRMRSIEVRDGRYVEIIDHGPVAPKAPEPPRRMTAADIGMEGE